MKELTGTIMRKRFKTSEPKQGKWGWYDDPQDSAADPWYWRWWDGKQWREETKTRPPLILRIDPNVVGMIFMVLMILSLTMLTVGSVDNLSVNGSSHEGDHMITKSIAGWVLTVVSFVWLILAAKVRTPPKNPHAYLD